MSSPQAADHPSPALREHGVEDAAGESRPIVICEECGRKYSISLSKIKGSAAGFACRRCGHRIVVARTNGPQRVETLPWPMPVSPPEVAPADEVPLRRSNDPARRLVLVSVFGIFLAVAIAGAAGFFLMRTHGLRVEIEGQGRQAAQQLAGERIERIAAAAAEQTRQLLRMHADLDRRDLVHSAELRALVMQPVGRTGRAMLYALPEPDGVWRVWLHPEPSVIGADLSARRSDLGPHFPDFWKTVTGAAGGVPVSGHYLARGAAGGFQEQAMACWPVAGTSYVLAVEAPVEELAWPLLVLQPGAGELIWEIGLTAASLLGGTAFALVLLVLLCRIKRARPVA
jgi:DNA-directed RNA polymerase subunit RPC12/RpoP